jgi:hypothetical protein
VVETRIAAGFVGGEGFGVDTSLIIADANKQRWMPGKDWDKNRDPETASRAVWRNPDIKGTIGAEEKRAALQAWYVHLLAAAEGRLTAVKVLPFSRARSGAIAPVHPRSRFAAHFFACRNRDAFKSH